MQLGFLDKAVSGHHCRGTKIIPFSLHNVDEILNDLELNISAGARALQWARAGQTPRLPQSHAETGQATRDNATRDQPEPLMLRRSVTVVPTLSAAELLGVGRVPAGSRGSGGLVLVDRLIDTASNLARDARVVGSGW
jgi:hypothetical protein